MAGLDPAIQGRKTASEHSILDGRLKAAHGEKN
jgi:hypothetical protein